MTDDSDDIRATESGNVTLERDDGVGRVTLDRPDAYNSLDAATARDLRAAVVELAEDDAVRCLVLGGNGPAFCSGADLGSFEGDASDRKRLDSVATPLHKAVETLATAKKPTVTAVAGVAAGGGLGLALAADVVLAHEDARFEFTYTRIGLSGDGGSTWFLPRLLGYRRAREFALLDEPISAEEAAAEGLATEAVPADEFEARVDEVAKQFADGPTRAYANIKRLLARSEDRDLPAQLAAEKDTITRLSSSADYATGYEAFFGDGEPEFEGR
ncbi:enoyl-CoA hydratase/isomerase family protein [Haloarchaeobius salinus]|uniref:enoyl-CoA hydratase/isomerase family protein n=1 Tax=Haloarchaeobius salinus TaxID=1198298 RepID=UPI00210D927C|nr:enoyl-CoA hydratase-related protein [Haloarchaeobius salinus]